MPSCFSGEYRRWLLSPYVEYFFRVRSSLVLVILVLAAATVAVPARGYGHFSGDFKVRNVEHPGTCRDCANGPGPCGEGPGSGWVTHSEASLASGAYSTEPTPFSAGSVLTVVERFLRPRQGYRVLELCLNPNNHISEDCFKIQLKRDKMDISSSPYNETAPHLAPFASHCEQRKDMVKTRWLLPENVVASHAVLRWRWITGDTCPSGLNWTLFKTWKSASGCQVPEESGTRCDDKKPFCVVNSGCRPEEFRNCADIRLVPGGASKSAVPQTQGFMMVTAGQMVEYCTETNIDYQSRTDSCIE